MFPSAISFLNVLHSLSILDACLAGRYRNILRQARRESGGASSEDTLKPLVSMGIKLKGIGGF
jgi:hypothetical protein